ncbi:hypothetical protein OAO01_07795 [Oligoflexia bacterium]|nr:hypothetical protein [Oligoflexia bacterium]
MKKHLIALLLLLVPAVSLAQGHTLSFTCEIGFWNISTQGQNVSINPPPIGDRKCVIWFEYRDSNSGDRADTFALSCTIPNGGSSCWREIQNVQVSSNAVLKRTVQLPFYTHAEQLAAGCMRYQMKETERSVIRKGNAPGDYYVGYRDVYSCDVG